MTCSAARERVEVRMGAGLVTLENDALRVQISARGAEMQSIVKKDSGCEYLWQGDSAVWSDRAPWLFPIIGQLRGGAYRCGGREYALPMHGFASGMTFEVETSGGTEAVFTLRATEETLEMYPWRFMLTIAYALREGELRIRCAVRCEDGREMYFSLGAHPGFVCAPGDVLSFEGAGALACQRLNPGSHLLEEQSVELGEAIELREELFDADAMLLRAPACAGATLRRRDGTGVRFEFGRVPWVGVWTRARSGLRYVCIEPWYGVDDPVDAQGDIERKPDIVRLPAGDTFEMNLSIRPQ